MSNPTSLKLPPTLSLLRPTPLKATKDYEGRELRRTRWRTGVIRLRLRCSFRLSLLGYVPPHIVSSKCKVQSSEFRVLNKGITGLFVNKLSLYILAWFAWFLF